MGSITWPWHRHPDVLDVDPDDLPKVDLDAAEQAKIEARRKHAEALEQSGRIRRLAAVLKEHRDENHFAEHFRAELERDDP